MQSHLWLEMLLLRLQSESRPSLCYSQIRRWFRHQQLRFLASHRRRRRQRLLGLSTIQISELLNARHQSFHGLGMHIQTLDTNQTAHHHRM
jgi:hypothetical protein